jgi:hypothetical protein
VLSVANKPIMLSVIMLNVDMLKVVAPPKHLLLFYLFFSSQQVEQDRLEQTKCLHPFLRRHDTQHSDTQPNDTEHVTLGLNGTQHNNILPF